ncbi:MAG: response regulator transcription factor [Spirosomataceae bacterium]
MLKNILLYGAVLGLLVFALNAIQYWFWIRIHSFELYGGLVAGLFLALGIWFGRKLTTSTKPLPTLKTTTQNEAAIAQLGISKREYDVLVLLCKGLSNQAIADQLFVSQNTIKTHTSRLFEKLDVKNRAQAILKAQEMGIIGSEPQQP